MDSTSNKNTGFNRLRTITKGALAAGAAVIAAPMMSARAEPMMTPSLRQSTTITISNNPAQDLSVRWGVYDSTSSCSSDRTGPSEASARSGSSCGYSMYGGFISGDSRPSGPREAPPIYRAGMSLNSTQFSNPIADVDHTTNTVTSLDYINLIPGIDANIQHRFYFKRAIARALYTFTNTTGEDISAEVVIDGFSGATQLDTTSDGDTSIEDHDYWSISHYTPRQILAGLIGPPPEGEGEGEEPMTLFTTITRYGEGAQVIPSTLSELGSPMGEGGPVDLRTAARDYNVPVYAYLYNITVPANSTVHLVNFVEIHTDLASAQAHATDFNSAGALQRAGLIDDAAALLKGPVLNYGINGDNAPSTPSSLDKIKAATESTGAAGITLPGLGVLAGLLIARRRRQK